MGNNLPFELIAQIAQYRRHDSQRFLSQYVLVSRTWQAVFEPFIYDRVCIHSESFKTGKGATSLEALTSNAHHVAARRKMIREILYCIILPFDLPDYQSVIIRTPEQTYTPDNPIRRANNEAFEAGILNLFALLTGIAAGQRMTIRIETLGREKCYEPGTVPWDMVGTARGKWAVRPYRAEFSNKDVPLPRAPCVDRIIADASDNPCSKRIRLEAACSISQACHTLSYIQWETDDLPLPEHLDYAQQRRKYALHLPATLRTYDLRSLTTNPLHESLPAPVLLSGENDLLTSYISVWLRELRLEDVPLANDFLCPLNDQAKLRGEPIYRPDFLPSGEWLNGPGPITDNPGIGDIDAPDFDYAEEVERINKLYSWNGYIQLYYEREMVKREPYLLSNISLRYAARYMPRLQHLVFQFAIDPETDMTFVKGKPEEEATLVWIGDRYNDHRPDERVAHAWGFRLNEGRGNSLSCCDHQPFQIRHCCVRSIEVSEDDKEENDPPGFWETCVNNVVREHCQKSPDATAVDAWDGSFTYGELDNLSDGVASILCLLGVRPETIVPICLEKSR
ncbi:hypothetical protein BJX99DRAFT_244382 [Aspergillus californicus]